MVGIVGLMSLHRITTKHVLSVTCLSQNPISLYPHSFVLSISLTTIKAGTLAKYFASECKQNTALAKITTRTTRSGNDFSTSNWLRRNFRSRGTQKETALVDLIASGHILRSHCSSHIQEAELRRQSAQSPGQGLCSQPPSSHAQHVQNSCAASGHITPAALGGTKIIVTQMHHQQSSSSNLLCTMCYVEDVFHVKCGHWGRRRFVGEPCVRSRTVKGKPTGCFEVEVVGMSNCNQVCWLCKRLQAPSSSSTTVVSFITSTSTNSLNTVSTRQTTSTTLTTPSEQATKQSTSCSVTAITAVSPDATVSSVTTEAWVTGRSPNPKPLTPEQLQRLMLYGKLNFMSSWRG